MSQVPIPGTVHLVDLEGTSRLQHGHGAKDVILVPQPSDDPNDPLNWSKWRRHNSSLWQFLWTFFGAMYINGLSPAYLLIESETGITVADLNLGIGLMYLFFGFGNLLTQPLALNYGRRPAAFISIFVTSFLVLWASFMKTAGEWYANRVLVGIFYSGIECLIELCITDTKFLHERGLHMGIFNFALFGGAFIAPIPAGFLADAYGWRWINRMYFIVGIVLSFGVFFCFEETMFYRPGPVNEFLDRQDGPGAQIDQVTGAGAGETTSHPQDAKSAVPEMTEKITGGGPPSSDSAVEVGNTYTYKKESYWRRLRLWNFRHPQQPNNFFRFMLVPIILFRYPSIVFSGLLVGSVLSWYNVLVGTITSVFGSDPYNFSANMIGLVYISCVIGATVGCMIAGWFNDYVAMYIARRRHGVKEPEARLWVAVITLILHPAGCILYGVGAAHHIHWVGVCFGIGITTLSIVMGSTLALSYAIDCYKEVAGEALVSVVIVRNVIGFAFSYAVTPMVNNLGLQGAFLLIAFLGMGITALCFVMIVVGKKMRKATAPSYWTLIEQYGFRAH